MTFDFFDFLGTVGVAIMIVAYLLLQLDRLDSKSLTYSLLNAVGAGLVVISLLFKFNPAAFIIEVFWILISLFGIVRALRTPGLKS
jgi:hypothetical protein